MKTLLIFSLLLLAIYSQDQRFPRNPQNCFVNGSSMFPSQGGWFWDSASGHCDYCDINCVTCGSKFNECENCNEGSGQYVTDTKMKKCQSCNTSNVLDCCWNDPTHAWGFHAKYGKCSSNAVQYGHYCMKAIDNCEMHSKNEKSKIKDSEGYTKCYKCNQGYYLSDDATCEKCYHFDWQKLITQYNAQDIPKDKAQKFENKDITEYKAIDNICQKCNGPGQCTFCNRGYFMGTNNFRQTYDRNIARNPSTCRKCNANDEVHEKAGYDINLCANECKSATDVDKVVCKTKDNLNTCFKDPQKNNGCRPCKEIVFKFTNTSGTLITVNIGNNCAQCLYDSNSQTIDLVNTGHYCNSCQQGYVSVPFYNNVLKKEWGVLCLKIQADTGVKVTVNPSLEGSSQDAVCSPTEQQIAYSLPTVIEQNVVRDSNYFTSDAALKIRLYTQKYHFTVTNCGDPEIKLLNSDSTSSSMDAIYYSQCKVNQCHNGYTDYIQKMKFSYTVGVDQKKISAEQSVIVCRRCSTVIQERDAALSLLNPENYKYVRRCSTSNEKYEITQCAFSVLEKIEEYPNNIFDKDKEDEHKYRGPTLDNFMKNRFTTGRLGTIKDQIYLVKFQTSHATYDTLTACIRNNQSCRTIAPPTSQKTAAEAYKELRGSDYETAYCSNCYTQANSGVNYVLTTLGSCKICSVSNVGCISCAKVTSDKSDEIYCKECATNIQLPYLDLYSTTKSPGLSDYDKDKWLYMDLTESQQKNYATITPTSDPAAPGKVTCTRCSDKACKNCGTDASKCETCQPFYRKNNSGACEKCYDKDKSVGVQHCMDCKADITKCDACMDGYVVFELTASKITICDKCEDNCQTCVVSANGRKSCRVCKSGFYLNPGLQTCQAKRYGCTNQYNIQSGDCTSCQYGFTLINGGWCYDCMRQNYSTGDTPDTGLTDSFANYHGFVYCPWSKACAGNDEILTYTNVRRPAARRILDLLDEIFE